MPSVAQWNDAQDTADSETVVRAVRAAVGAEAR